MNKINIIKTSYMSRNVSNVKFFKNIKLPYVQNEYIDNYTSLFSLLSCFLITVKEFYNEEYQKNK